MIEENSFTQSIHTILNSLFGDKSEDIFNNNQLLQYINLKTKSANKGSKSRASIASLYSIYVIVEDYLQNGFAESGEYKNYHGSQYTKLMNRQHELPFGEKFQNHALNNRTNSEFEGLFSAVGLLPIIRDAQSRRYWINESLLITKIGDERVNVARAIIAIIDEYVRVKQRAFERFIEDCERLQKVDKKRPQEILDFLLGLLAPNVDARLFEIVSFSIMKYYYLEQSIVWGYDSEHLTTEELKLYKTGRTNANDGGIDFVMKPLGRFFQVTESLNFKKYFLDIDKVERYPITFVVKSEKPTAELYSRLRHSAQKSYGIVAIVDKYMACIEEIINIEMLKSYLVEIGRRGFLSRVLEEVVLQSRVEFNSDEE